MVRSRPQNCISVSYTGLALMMATALATPLVAEPQREFLTDEDGSNTDVSQRSHVDEIVANVISNFRAIRNLKFRYAVNVEGKYAFSGSLILRDGKVRLELSDPSGVRASELSPEERIAGRPELLVHVFDGVTHHQLLYPRPVSGERRQQKRRLLGPHLVRQESSILTAPYGHVSNPLGMQYGWHVLPSVDGFGIVVNEDKAWRNRFDDAIVLGQEHVNGWKTTVVAIREFPTLPIDLNGRHKKLYLSHEHNFAPVKYTVSNKLTVSVAKMHSSTVDGRRILLPLEVTSSSGTHIIVDESSIEFNPKVDDSTFTVPTPEGFHDFPGRREGETFIHHHRFSGEADISASYERALKDASLMGKHVLLFIADGTEVESHRLSFEIYVRGRELRLHAQPFETVHIDTSHGEQVGDFLSGVGIAANSLALPAFVALDAEGRVMGQLVGVGLRDVGKLSEFLLSNSPRSEDAAQRLATAFVRARMKNKHVLLQESGFACRPCVLLSRFLDSNWMLFEADYILVHVNTSNDLNGHETMARYRRGTSSIPWFAILDKNENVLATSNSRGGNIGFPSTTESINHFIDMLRTTSSMSDDNLREIERRLTD